MKTLYRYSQLIILGWGVIVLLAFKLYNNFIFSNNQSLIFIALFFGVPLVFIFFKSKATIKNKKAVSANKTDFYHKIILSIENDFIPKLTFCITDYQEANLSFSRLGNVKFTETYALLTVEGTLIRYYFHYGKNLIPMTKDDYHGLDKRPLSYFYQKLFDKIRFLVESSPLTYIEYYKGTKLLAVVLKRKDEVLYFHSDAKNPKLKEKKGKIKEIII